MRTTLDYKRPAVFFVNRLGDQLIALPAMRALADLFPSGIQLFLGEGMFSFFYRGLPVGETVRLRWDDYEKGTIDVAGVARSAASSDLLICLSTPFHCAAELAHRMGARRIVGCSEIFDEQVRTEDCPHQFDRLFAIPRHFEPSLRFDQFCAPPVFSDAAEAAAARYVSANCRSGERLLFVHPETRPEKTWARELFGWVLERFLTERPEYRVVVSSLAPFDLGVHDGRVIQIDLHLELTLALVRHADLFLGVDSCFLHAADLFRIPGVALFGPTDPREWGFRLSPCSRHVAEESMDKIRPEPVLEALIELAAAVDDGSCGGRAPLSVPLQKGDLGSVRETISAAPATCSTSSTQSNRPRFSVKKPDVAENEGVSRARS